MPDSAQTCACCAIWSARTRASPGQDLGTVRVERQPRVFDTDLETVSGAPNLQQALLLRFLTRQWANWPRWATRITARGCSS